MENSVPTSQWFWLLVYLTLPACLHTSFTSPSPPLPASLHFPYSILLSVTQLSPTTPSLQYCIYLLPIPSLPTDRLTASPYLPASLSPLLHSFFYLCSSYILTLLLSLATSFYLSLPFFFFNPAILYHFINLRTILSLSLSLHTHFLPVMGVAKTRMYISPRFTPQRSW